MKKEYQDVISVCLGVEPIEINSALVSAQNRKRLYWTNIPGVEHPEDRGIMLKNIIHENVGEKIVNPKRYMVPFDRTLQILDKEVQKGKIGYFRKDCQANRVYSIHGKAVTLCGEAGGGAAKMGQYLFGRIAPDRVNKRQNGRRFNDGNKFYTLTAQDKHGVLIDGYIRKLTPIECERLQTLPDGYTEGISNTQRYKCLGNGWTVDVIAHIFSYIKECEQMKMKVKLDEHGIMPTRAHDTDAGLDIMTPFEVYIQPQSSVVVHTGVHIELPPGTCGILKSKSGLSINHGITTVDGVIDEGYTGEITVRLLNDSTETHAFSAGDKITQLVIVPYFAPELELVDELEATERGDNGFGSTGR